MTGSARTRRSLADQPEGPFRYEQVAAPGELMQIDSTPLDALVRLDEGVPTLKPQTVFRSSVSPSHPPRPPA